MPLKPFDVIWIFDGCIRPPGPKMVVCVEPELGLFFRINSKPWQTAVKLEMSSHPFLIRDSYLECGEPIELDEYVVDESLRDKGLYGTVLSSLADAIYGAVHAAKRISDSDKEAIRKAIGAKRIVKQEAKG
jgi:hypothetical protein